MNNSALASGGKGLRMNTLGGPERIAINAKPGAGNPGLEALREAGDEWMKMIGSRC
jgi:hypothetical protein